MTKQKTKPNTIDAFILTIIIHEILQILEQSPPGTLFESVDYLHCNSIRSTGETALSFWAEQPDGTTFKAIIDPFALSIQAPWRGPSEEDIAEAARHHGQRFGVKKLKELREKRDAPTRTDA